MPLIFPSSPTVGQTYQSGSSGTFVYNGEAWDTQNASVPITAATASYALTASFVALAKSASFLDGAIPTYVQAGNGSTQSIPYNTSTVVQNWTNTITPSTSEWNSTAGTFTATKAGTYLVTLVLTYGDVGAAGLNREYSCAIAKNGTNVGVGWFFTTLTNSTIKAAPPVSVIVTVVPGDVITPRAYQTITNGAVSLLGRADANLFTMQELPSRIMR